MSGVFVCWVTDQSAGFSRHWLGWVLMLSLFVYSYARKADK